MMVHHCATIVFLTILLSNASIKAENEIRERTKFEKCEDAYGKCISSLILLKNIAWKTNNEAMGLKFKKENLAFDNRDINREIRVLRHRIANPSSPALNLPQLGRSGNGIGLLGFVNPSAFNNCTSLNECLGTMIGVKNYWQGLEDMKTSFNSEIITLQSEKTSLENLRENLKQQLANILEN